MFAQNTWRRWTLLVVAVALLIPATIFPGQKHKKKKNQEDLPNGIPVLWRAPADISKRDLYWGQGGKAMRPDLREVTLIKKEPGGYSTKYRVRDASGHEWVAKIGKEAKGETAASRLMWAVGYFPDVNYLVPRVHVKGLDKDLENVRFGLRPKDVKRVDGWQWKKNPFVGSREFQGMKVMMAVLNNWDIKDSNNKVAVVKNDKIADKELRYFVSDLGGSFGKVSHIPRFLYFKPDRNNPKAYAKTRLINKVKDDRVDFHYKLKRKDLFKNITVDQAQWISGWLSRLSDRQLADAFRAANYSPEEVRMMSHGVRQRIRELQNSTNRLAMGPRR
ncbi:MAG TPA: hypothetical protein VN956_16730 [Pyrinomonadaceae bacterium]|nr:hypothetical protein [Pyrinomonadaceae bacterium]